MAVLVVEVAIFKDGGGDGRGGGGGGAWGREVQARQRRGSAWRRPDEEAASGKRSRGARERRRGEVALPFAVEWNFVGKSVCKWRSEGYMASFPAPGHSWFVFLLYLVTFFVSANENEEQRTVRPVFVCPALPEAPSSRLELLQPGSGDSRGRKSERPLNPASPVQLRGRRDEKYPRDVLCCGRLCVLW